METKEKSNGQLNGAIAVKDDKKNQFVAGNPVNSVSVKTDEVKKDEPTKEEAKPATPAPAQTEAKKVVMNLEGTLKFIEEMHERKVKRDKYLATLKNLDEFEIDLKKENDDIDNYYTGCSLTVQDDAGRKFTTKNPVIIWTIAQQITSICEGKLAEVEAHLVLPA